MKEEILENLKKSIIRYDVEGAGSWAKKAVEEGVDPLEALSKLTEGIRQVGDGYNKEELWLPELVGAASAMQSATPIIEEEIRRRGVKAESLGTVAIGTVYGDVHSIGKNMVATLLRAGGFTVHDLGVNVAAENFIEATRKYQVDILAMSALMTTTASEQMNVIATLKKEGIRDKIKIMVGGAAITQEFADSIGADGYDPTAPGAVKLARILIEKSK